MLLAYRNEHGLEAGVPSRNARLCLVDFSNELFNLLSRGVELTHDGLAAQGYFVDQRADDRDARTAIGKRADIERLRDGNYLAQLCAGKIARATCRERVCQYVEI